MHTLMAGDPVTVYVQNLLDMNTWGGAVELTIFSQLYQVEIFSFDITGPSLYRCVAVYIYPCMCARLTVLRVSD